MQQIASKLRFTIILEITRPAAITKASRICRMFSCLFCQQEVADAASQYPLWIVLTGQEPAWRI
jgi:hypothetical protein